MRKGLHLLYNEKKGAGVMEKSEKIRILQDLIKIPSVNGKEAEVADYLAKLFAKYGISSKRIVFEPGRDNLIAELKSGRGKKVLGITGHMDVVAAGDDKLWKYPPFSAQIDGNRLYGRGSTDMKSGLAALAIALIELVEKKTPLNGTLRFMGTVGEEVGELGAGQLTKMGYADDLAGLLIGEPTNDNLAYTHMGSLNYSVLSHGKEAHSSMPREGFNAIDHLNEFITRANQAMQKVAEKYQDPALGHTIHNVTMIQGGTQVNSIPGSAALKANIRTIPEFGNEKVIALLKKITNELNEHAAYKLELHVDYDKIPVQADKNSSLIRTIQRQFSKPLPLIGISATTDAAEFTKAPHPFDLVVFGPGVPTLPHQINEYVEIDNYLAMIEKYQDIFADYLK